MNRIRSDELIKFGKLENLARSILGFGGPDASKTIYLCFFVNKWVIKALILPEKVETPRSSSFLVHDPLLEKYKIRFQGDQKIGFSG